MHDIFSIRYTIGGNEMTSAQETHYRAYVELTTKNNVEPIVYEDGVLQVDLDGEVWTRSEGRYAMTHRWGDPEYGPVTVYTSNLGRVMEIQSIRRGLSSIRAIHRTQNDYFNYRRPMGMFHYLYT
jgi:hypothetical protein